MRPCGQCYSLARRRAAQVPWIASPLAEGVLAAQRDCPNCAARRGWRQKRTNTMNGILLRDYAGDVESIDMFGLHEYGAAPPAPAAAPAPAGVLTALGMGLALGVGIALGPAVRRLLTRTDLRCPHGGARNTCGVCLKG